MEFPSADEFLARCDEHKNKYLNQNPKVEKERKIKLETEIKMMEIENDLRLATLKIQKLIMDYKILDERKFIISMSDLSRHTECHPQIKIMINKLADEKGYKVTYTIKEYEVQWRSKVDTYTECNLVPLSEYTE